MDESTSNVCVEFKDESGKVFKKQRAGYSTKECRGTQLGGYYVKIKDASIVRVLTKKCPFDGADEVEIMYGNGRIEKLFSHDFHIHFREATILMDA
jgi:hypothetical protein